MKDKILCKEYVNLPETRPFTTTSSGIITAAKNFLYLSINIHFTLKDAYDVQSRVNKALQIMGALNFYWSCQEIELWAKTHVYNPCVIAVLLWG